MNVKQEYYFIVVLMSAFLIQSCSVSGDLHQFHKYRDCSDMMDITVELHQMHKFCDCNGIPEDSLKLMYCEMSHSLTEPNAVKIEFYAYTLKNGKKETFPSGVIWFSKGYLFMRQHEPNETYYIATVNDNLYEWYSNKKKGTIYKRYEGDTLDFLHYFVDPGFFKYFSYQQYLEDPNAYLVTENAAIKRIIIKEPSHDSHGIEVLLNPFWLYSITTVDYEENIFTTDVVERPQPVDKIPGDIQQLPDSVIFEQSNKTIAIKFGYL